MTIQVLSFCWRHISSVHVGTLGGGEVTQQLHPGTTAERYRNTHAGLDTFRQTGPCLQVDGEGLRAQRQEVVGSLVINVILTRLGLN